MFIDTLLKLDKSELIPNLRDPQPDFYLWFSGISDTHYIINHFFLSSKSSPCNQFLFFFLLGKTINKQNIILPFVFKLLMIRPVHISSRDTSYLINEEKLAYITESLITISLLFFLAFEHSFTKEGNILKHKSDYHNSLLKIFQCLSIVLRFQTPYHLLYSFI